MGAGILEGVTGIVAVGATVGVDVGTGVNVDRDVGAGVGVSGDKVGAGVKTATAVGVGSASLSAVHATDARRRIGKITTASLANRIIQRNRSL